jgi:hypothetical protein
MAILPTNSVEFLQFWGRCIHSGWQTGNYVIDAVFLVWFFIAGGLAAGLFFLKKLRVGKWKKWEDRLMRGAFWSFIVAFFISTFCVAPFLQ